MATPLYKSLKENGTSFYAFPSASEDISSVQQNSSKKVYFSKYVLLNLPSQNLEAGIGTQSKPVYFDFDSAFKRSANATSATTFGDQIVESLRNYVANHETTIRDSRLNNTNFYYNNSSLKNTTEKIFFKWAKKLNIIDFDLASGEDEYFSRLSLFQSNNQNDDMYFPEYLWKEREIVDYNIRLVYESDSIIGKLEVEFDGTTNFKKGDVVNIYNVGIEDINLEGINTLEGINVRVLLTIAQDDTRGQRVVFDVDGSNLSIYEDATNIGGKAELVYNRLVQYIGDVIGVNNVQEANRSATEVHINIPDHTGQTPDVLFRTMVDENYKPNLNFPIIPSEYQPEIKGAETFISPIVNTPQNYPGSHYGQFDTSDFTYSTKNGDSIRRRGDYYGVKGDVLNPIFDGSTIDGISIDFDTNHYVKMNISNRVLTNFEQFNAVQINNEPPISFEFNAILWYYTIEDSEGNSAENLYGISFLNNPENNELEHEAGLRFPTVKKFVTNGYQDGTAYAFSLNLNYNIINENPVEPFNPRAINSVFSMDLFNKAMGRLASVNDSFLNIINDNAILREELSNLRSMIYNQNEISVINNRIDTLSNYLKLYSTMQITKSDTIDVNVVSGPNTYLSLESVATNYSSVFNFKSTEMYTPQGIVPINLRVDKNRDFLIHLENNDEVEMSFDDNLTFVLDRDLALKQTAEFVIKSSQTSTQNKRLNIYMKSSLDNNTPSEVLILGDVNLPVFYNSINEQQNSAYLWHDFKFNINLENPINLNVGNRLEVSLQGTPSLVNNSIKAGDTLVLNNLFLGTSSIYDFSGQYTVTSVPVDTNYVILDISNNRQLVGYGASASFPWDVTNQLANMPYFTLNKGMRIKITRISNSIILKERYSITIEDFKY